MALLIKSKPKINLSELKMATAVQQSKAFGESGVLTIVNSARNGKRLMFSSEVYRWLNEPEHLQLAFFDNALVVGTNLSDVGLWYGVRKQSSKCVVYCGHLVHEVSEQLALDFTDRVSITLTEVDYETDEEGYPYVVIYGNAEPEDDTQEPFEENEEGTE